MSTLLTLSHPKCGEPHEAGGPFNTLTLALNIPGLLFRKAN